MEAQLQHHHDHEDPHNEYGEGEKKSVLKKVKDKAKKIKDTIKNHGHTHEGAHRRADIYQQGYEEEEDEVENDPEVHGAPMYDSSAIESRVNLEKPMDEREDRYQHNDLGLKPELESPIQREKTIKILGLEVDPNSPANTPADLPPSNYQSKVADPTASGGKEADVAPLVHQLGNLNVHDQSAPQPNPESKPESNPTDEETLAGKISSAVASTKDTVASKLGYGGDGDSSSNIPASEYAAKVAETLTPFYDKVAGRVRGGDNMASMREYFSEKFRPGDEDRALSEVITNALRKKGNHEKQVGRVTMSEEVAAQLGGEAENKREGEDAAAAGQESRGQGVVDRVRNAVGLWLGKSNGIQTAQDSVGRSYVNQGGSGVGGTQVEPGRVAE